jgi:hypothetical protein
MFTFVNITILQKTVTIICRLNVALLEVDNLSYSFSQGIVLRY